MLYSVAAYDGPYVEIIDDETVIDQALERKRSSVKETARQLGVDVERALEVPHRVIRSYLINLFLKMKHAKGIYQLFC